MRREILARRYRRLLRIYPSGQRREELLDTLLEIAPEGRRRPTVRETVNLFRHGMRARLGRPASKAVVVAAVCVALVTGFLTAAFAARLAWESARPLPVGGEETQMVNAVFPGLDVKGGRDDELFVTPQGWHPIFGAEDDYDAGTAGYYVEHTPATRDYRRFTADVRDRLAAAGWQVSDIRPDGPTMIATGKLRETGQQFWAARDGLVLEFLDSTGSSGPDFTVTRSQPWWVPPIAALACLPGLLLGWLLVGWVSRRTERRSPVLQQLITTATVCALFAMLPAFAYGLMSLFIHLLPPASPLSAPLWYGLVHALGRTFAFVAVLLALLPIVAAALPLRDSSEASKVL